MVSKLEFKSHFFPVIHNLLVRIYLLLVILFLFPHTFSETITANILWQLIVFLGLTVLPISLAYSHNGVRAFANNRWNNFIQSPSIILPNV